MQFEQIVLNWERIGPLARERWPELTEEDVASPLDQDALDALIAERNPGLTAQEAKHQTQEWALRIKEEKGDVKLPEESAPPVEGESPQVPWGATKPN